MIANSDESVSAWKRFLRRRFPQWHLSDDEFVEVIRKGVERHRQAGIYGLISVLAINIAMLLMAGSLLAFALQKVPFGNNVPIQQMAIMFGVAVGAVIGWLMGKLEANIVHAITGIVTELRTQRLLVAYADQLREHQESDGKTALGE